MDYAIVRTGGKQYKVSPGDVLDVDKLPVGQGEKVELTDVLLLSHEGSVTIGSPIVVGAKVIGEVEEQRRGEKLIVFRFKSKTRQGKKTGHRQWLTRLRITEILTAKAQQPRRRRRSPEHVEEAKDGP